MVRISAIYPNNSGSRFNGADYTGRHRAFAAALLADHGLVGLRLTLGEAALDGGAPPYWAISEMWFESRGAFDAAIAACGAALFEDAVHYTDVAPVLQVSTLAGDA